MPLYHKEPLYDKEAVIRFVQSTLWPLSQRWRLGIKSHFTIEPCLCPFLHLERIVLGFFYLQLLLWPTSAKKVSGGERLVKVPFTYLLRNSSPDNVCVSFSRDRHLSVVNTISDPPPDRLPACALPKLWVEVPGRGHGKTLGGHRLNLDLSSIAIPTQRFWMWRGGQTLRGTAVNGSHVYYYIYLIYMVLKKEIRNSPTVCDLGQ